MQGFTSEELFELPVKINGAEMVLPAKWVKMGYTYKIYVEVENTEIIFEPDEERNFRAIIENETSKKISVQLIQAIGEALEKYLR